MSGRIVFVCEHGAAKSIIAAALFNRLAAQRGLAVRAVSRGTAPDHEVPALVRTGLLAEGVDIGEVVPLALDTTDAQHDAIFVVFDVSVSVVLAGGIRVRHWNGLPLVMENYRIARDAIAARVERLISEFARGDGFHVPCSVGIGCAQVGLQDEKRSGQYFPDRRA